jgi:Putative inner membrane protein (DUF1819)
VKVLTSNIMKVGAHLDDTRALVEVWDRDLSVDRNLERIVDENLLGLPSRSRAHDVVTRALRPRFIAPDAGIIEALAAVAHYPDVFRDACYYELARVEALVAAFAEEKLFEWWIDGRTAIGTGDARQWIDKLTADGRVPDWSPNIRTRVARSLLAALRDLGRLVGARSSPRKEIVRPGVSSSGFAYTAFRLHQQGESSRGILNSPVWSLWLLDANRVDELMHAVAGRGAAFYSVAGSSLRIDWRLPTLAEVARAAL